MENPRVIVPGAGAGADATSRTRRGIGASLSVVLAAADEAQLRGMQALIARLRPHWRVLATLHDPASLPEVLECERPSLCVLGLGRAQSGGIEVLRRVPPSPPVVCVAGDAALAAPAFESSAIDFIVEPVPPRRFELALERAEREVARMAAEALIFRAQGGTPRGGAPSMVQILRGTDLVIAPLRDVLYLQADRKYTRVVLAAQDGILRMALHAIETCLDTDRFWRIHRGYIINARHAALARRDDLGRLMVQMRDRPESLPVARPHEHLFRNGIF